MRFDIGVAWQILRNKGYKCSIATYGHLVDVDSTMTEKEQLDATKVGIYDHYNYGYGERLEARESITRSDALEGNLSNLIGTKRPLDKWEHTSYDTLYSFYAGKVRFPRNALIKVAMDCAYRKRLSRCFGERWIY